ncbi:unnamed protein product [Adineta ricciae]|uniref:Craniofacial development protein 2-like n=1 Tax=Adineta ricciae TaxID=249248 RepID=A0A815ULP1_ADIRI|nr:unnamed protein product [Adineta ricciae]CAF1524222.1 unnamed protein product [Adineta ricciae]
MQRRVESKLTKSKTLDKTITISTYNIRTLKRVGKLHQIVHGRYTNNIYLVVVQEYRWHTQGRTGQGGVGLLMNPRFSALISSSEKISYRILMVRFKGNPAITIIVAYAPIEDKSTADKDVAYDDLQQFTLDVPPHYILILAGDLNARTGTYSHSTNP